MREEKNFKKLMMYRKMYLVWHVLRLTRKLEEAPPPTELEEGSW